MRAFQTLSNLDVNYIVLKRITSSEREVIEGMDEETSDWDPSPCGFASDVAAL